VDAFLPIAAVLLFLLGLAHSYLGERFILVPLLRRGHLPSILGSEFLCGRTLRFAWHLTTIAWWGAAGILVVLASSPPTEPRVLIGRLLAVTFLLSGAVALCVTRGRHLSWVVFFAIAVLTCFGVAG
jgi:hypothetical protein